MNRKSAKRATRPESSSGLDSPAAILVVALEQAPVSIATVLGSLEHDVHSAEDPEQALAVLRRTPMDLIITRLSRSAAPSLAFLKHAKELCPETEILVVAADENPDIALQAMKLGAHGYLKTPFRSEELSVAVARALERTRLIDRLRRLEDETKLLRSLDGIIGRSQAMRDVVKVVRQVARLDSTVLVSGENGTGKELIARTMHSLSPRCHLPLVTICCGAIPGALQEGELFGHTAGGIPGTRTTKRGLFEEADGGTVFVDEVGELASAAQRRLLRFLQDGEVPAVGSEQSRLVDVRIIAATNRSLEESVENQTFLEDLFYRLNIIPIHIPPLRERPDDIPLLAQRFVERSAAKMEARPAPSISPSVMSFLLAQPWRGNVRELECAIERAVALDRDGVIGMDDLALTEVKHSQDKALDRARKDSLSLSELEREYILEVLSEYGGSRKKTAERLGITTATLWRKLKQYEREG